jgi:hypothetical protein
MQFPSEEEIDPKASLSSLKGISEQIRVDWTPMHYAAENGSLNVILVLVSRGAGIDPTD